MRLCILGVLLVVLAGCGTSRHTTALRPTDVLSNDARREAIIALQDADSADYIAEADIRDVARALQEIRVAFAEIRGLDAGHDISKLHLILRDTMRATMARLHPAALDSGYVRSRTGLTGIDSINRAIGAPTVGIWGMFTGRRWMLEPQFIRPINVAMIARHYRGRPEIGYAATPLAVGGRHYIRARKEAGAFLITFSRGWGDCPSSCINRRLYPFRYDRSTGTITKLPESGSPWVPGGA